MLSISNMSLQKKISLFVLAGLALSLGLFSLISIQSFNESTRRILEQRLSTAQILANNIDDDMTHALEHMQKAAIVDSIPSDSEFAEMVRPLRSMLTDTDIFVENMFLVSTGGKILQVDPYTPSIIGANWSQLPEIRQTLETGKPMISNQLSEPQTTTQMVLAIVPVVDGTNHILGLLVASIDPVRSSLHTVSEVLQAGRTGYVEIVDGNGLVLARTEPGIPPKSLEKTDHPGRFTDLIKENKAVVRTCHRCHEVNQEIFRRRDIIAFAPLTTVQWGVAIRQSEDEALAPTRQLEARLLLLGVILLIGALLLVWFVVQGVVKPLRMLKVAAQRVAVGNFETAVPQNRKDEIGELRTSFYTMTQELAKSRNQLLSRNKELAAMNAVSVAVSQSLDLKQLSGSALKNVLEVTQSTAGCVFVCNEDNNRLEPMIILGSAGAFGCQKSGVAGDDCACRQVLRLRQTMMVTDESQCPLLNVETSVTSFASIPLKSKDRALGVMNVACTGEQYFTEKDFELFNSIGFQVGLAMENSYLYNEAKQKEELRGQLLNSIISAQEEERKRISRELHDGSGQALTAAIMNVESVETLIPEREAVLKNKIESVKSLIAHTLEDIRRLTHDLRPMALDDLGLASAIRAYVKNRLEPANIRVKFESKGLNTGRRLSPAIETAIFRIIQEATNNIIKHANAHTVAIYLSLENEMIKAIVQDDGKGFESGSIFTSESRRSLGLLGIKERVALLGGNFNIQSRPHQGTRIVVEIPAVYSSPAAPVKSEQKQPGPV